MKKIIILMMMCLTIILSTFIYSDECTQYLPNESISNCGSDTGIKYVNGNDYFSNYTILANYDAMYVTIYGVAPYDNIVSNIPIECKISILQYKATFYPPESCPNGDFPKCFVPYCYDYDNNNWKTISFDDGNSNYFTDYPDVISITWIFTEETGNIITGDSVAELNNVVIIGVPIIIILGVATILIPEIALFTGLGSLLVVAGIVVTLVL